MRSSIAICLLAARIACAADAIPAAQAKDHVGETASVCGVVAATRYLDSSEKKPTFLNFDKPYPNHSFTAVIFGTERARFGKPEEDYLHKDICVTGKIELYNGKPQVVLSAPDQIKSL